MSMAPNVKICTGAILQFDGEAFREANNKCETGCLTDKGMQYSIELDKHRLTISHLNLLVEILCNELFFFASCILDSPRLAGHTIPPGLEYMPGIGL